MVNLTNKTIPHHPFFSLLSYILSTKSQINQVQIQFDQLKFSANSPDGFGLSLQSQAFINIGYPNIDLKPGQLYNKLDVAAMPTISISPLAATVQKFKAPNVFTLIMSDANTLGMPDPKGNFRYFLENGVTFDNPSSNNSFEMDLNEESGS
ncbi:hypothetical protein DFH28DRAFT_530262 [Melampsora americana]|nr:hypothetical protein DFH28DRAFT_530262 [Melampsora americana]